jgi:tRNA pseudouridine55 synthase
MVAALRRHTGLKKVGHGGTLDPFATGLLLMLLGKATRLFDFLAPLEKTYEVTVRFGYTSTTGDINGEISPAPGAIDEEALRRALPEFTGAISQQPHRYSAIKSGGESLYRKARRGEDVTAPERQVFIRSLELLSFDRAGGSARLRVVCSKGTYIRSLCEDVAARLGTGAYAAELRRTSIGDFGAGDAITPAALESIPAVELLNGSNPAFISCLGALYFLPVREVDDTDGRAVTTGRTLPGESEGPIRIGHRGRLLAVYGPGEPGRLRPLAVLT